MGDFGSALQRLLSSTRKLDGVMERATLTAALAEEDYAPPRDVPAAAAAAIRVPPLWQQRSAREAELIAIVAEAASLGLRQKNALDASQREADSLRAENEVLKRELASWRRRF